MEIPHQRGGEVLGLVTLALICGIIGTVDACRQRAAVDEARLPPPRRETVEKETLRFDDGDSFGANGRDIRVLGIDAPEIAHPAHDLFEDQPFGKEAAALTEQALRAAKRIELLIGEKDAYDRTLAHVLIDGELLAVRLIRAGLAYETVTAFGSEGFPEQAAAIQEAWRTTPRRPRFERPWKWRRRQKAITRDE